MALILYNLAQLTVHCTMLWDYKRCQLTGSSYSKLILPNIQSDQHKEVTNFKCWMHLRRWSAWVVKFKEHLGESEYLARCSGVMISVRVEYAIILALAESCCNWTLPLYHLKVSLTARRIHVQVCQGSLVYSFISA